MSTQTAGRTDLLDGVNVLVQRWFVMLPILILTGLFVYRVYEDSTTYYEQTAALGIVTPSVITTQPRPATRPDGTLRPVTTQQNALTESGGVTLVANLVNLRLQQSQVRKTLATAAPGASYVAQVYNRNDNQGNLPVLDLSAKAGTRAGASAAIDALREATVSATRTVQLDAGVPEDRLATSYVVAAETTPTKVVVVRTRAAATVALAGVAVALVLTAITDALLRRRGRRSRQ